ncbi:MAG: DNA mismatch repair endonuclease MutL [Bacteroidales bacterium]|nr:DNA mismatch repair endonuclease MutL [Bacteroidales bacterium]
MSDIIKLLPDSVANQIAAGEVIQRPASVVKELVENAVDAGATNITVVLKDAGRTLIQVVDNGSGMSPTDARMAFERHSTSKITVADDLFSLRTMGFRGEALASIAAIAQVELISMRREDTVGTQLLISGSKVESQQPAAAAPGTNLMVKNIFFNVPARRKFLKKDSVELNNILHEFERLALVNPDLDLTIIHNDMTLHQLRHGSLKQRIGNLFGKSMERQLIPIETETSIVKITGFVGLPENARKRGALQYLFVNGRNMRHPYFHKAILNCYEQLIRPEEQPNYFVNFEVDPSTIDVNIHPTKNEIKFENEQAIWQILNAAVRESLGKFNAVPSIDFDRDNDVPEIPAFNPNAEVIPDFSASADYNPFAESEVAAPSSPSSWQGSRSAGLDNWEMLFQSFEKGREETIHPDSDTLFGGGTTGVAGNDIVASRINADDELIEPTADKSVGGEGTPKSTIQLNDKYIITPTATGLLIIDKHRAHVRVLYETYAKSCADAPLPSQKVMFPEAVNLTPARIAILNEYRKEITEMGFDLESMAADTWVINGIPAGISDSDNVQLLTSLLDDLQSGTDVTQRSVRQSIALHLAKAAAVNANRQLSDSEVEHLLSNLFSLSTPAYTPDGNKVIAEISTAEIRSLF